jgi:hypothetical protein
MVTLSRPRRASAPSAAPSATPGLSASCERHASAIRTADAASRSTSSPASAAGTSPNQDSAE